jgi:hypothetical protein
MMAHVSIASIGEAEVSLIQGQPGLHGEFKDSLGYLERLCLKKTNKIKKNININQEHYTIIAVKSLRRDDNPCLQLTQKHQKI